MQEPIVCALDDALSAFFAAGLDVLVLEKIRQVFSPDANADVAKGAALHATRPASRTPTAGGAKRVTRSTAGRSRGRQRRCHGASSRPTNLYRGSRDQTSPTPAYLGVELTHQHLICGTSYLEKVIAQCGFQSLLAVKRVRPPPSPRPVAACLIHASDDSARPGLLSASTFRKHF